MKTNILKNAFIAVGAFSGLFLTGCIEEVFPYDAATSEQVASNPESLEIIVKSLANYTIARNTYGGDDYTDAGLPGMMLARDAMCEDFPVYNDDYNWYASIEKGNGAYWGAYPYYYFYTFIDKANDLLKSVNLDALDSKGLHMVGNLYGFRAMCYLDMARMFEFFPTGFPELDNDAESKGILGLTVPIMEARQYTLEELMRNPRAPFYTMYRFIMNDLNKAEELLEGYEREKVSLMNRSVIYGFKARLWLDMATRFDRDADALAKQLAAEGSEDGYADLGITNALDCYRNAQVYAEKVMEGGFTPMTAAEWHDPDNGFCFPNNSWVWGSYITNSEEATMRWYAYHTWLNSDSSWAWGGGYNCYRMISKDLYDRISDADWRKTSWIDPEDAGDYANVAKYSTKQTAKLFEKIPAYGNLKFHVPHLSDFTPGLVCCTPFMRVEEMYLLRAEALYHTQGLDAAKAALESFVNTYRYTDGSYVCNAMNYTTFIKELMVQRRIELWGEGHVYFDYKRLRLGVSRTYEGTNYPADYRINTADGHVAPWMNCYISEYAISMKDENFKGNPDFSGIVKPVQ